MEPSKYEPNWEKLRKYIDSQVYKPENGWEQSDESIKFI